MCACSNRGSSLPKDSQHVKALGDTDKLNDDIRRAVTIGIDECFLTFPKPKRGDWVTLHKEEGQTVQEFERTKRTVPHSSHKTIYIQPIGPFDHPRAPSLEAISEFSSNYFPGCELEILPQIEFSDFSKHLQTGKRINKYSKQPQYLTGFIIGHLKKMKRRERKNDRRELFCIGVTMADIYPEASWNFVYGLASIDDGIGIYSFARLDPAFPDIEAAGPCTDEERTLIFRRAIGVFVHEVIHLFGFEHCIYYSCLMNGAESEEEIDRQPLYLCPVCLRKMYSAMGKEKQHFNVIEMYTKMLDGCKRLNLKDELQWYKNRLNILNRTADN
ncbi:unnamed protein product [Rotaria magnacalcarata]|uniref:Archaemetzincin-2 n=3 Tax=Rotaria magnacalcarata TaxID=392030 RepID=A0A816Z240_9BILA|nr:unnamed protein product [Rotaria magnacalcarata]CAF1570618.1 unnamed protein product [Rotaria magnacalcarata]CAF2088421.1 unnamed protein product [Rotaria magnacalcarata]CAF2107225.1 unnamed protein product [Rotaria magnacalcarata]CAF2190146.1 unnamed protein product [Rotaria magnacalcarata]